MRSIGFKILNGIVVILFLVVKGIVLSVSAISEFVKGVFKK